MVGISNFPSLSTRCRAVFAVRNLGLTNIKLNIKFVLEEILDVPTFPKPPVGYTEERSIPHHLTGPKGEGGGVNSRLASGVGGGRPGDKASA